MEDLESENLRALLRGNKLNTHQLYLANREYKAILEFAYKQEQEVSRLKKQ